MPTTPQPPAHALTVLVAVLTLTTLELVRSSGPLLDMAFSQGVVSAAGAALATYALSGLLALALVLTARRAGRLGPVVLGTLLLAAARLVVQGLEAGLRFGVGLLTVALAIAVLTLAVGALAGRAGGPRAASAVATGLAGAVGLQLVLATWDAYWRHDVLGWAVTALLAGALIAGALALRRDAAAGDGPTGSEVPALPAVRVGRLWALGPLLGLSAMVLANPAFAASQSGAPLAVAGPLVGGTWLLAAWDVLRRPPAVPAFLRRPIAVTDAAILPVLVAGSIVSSNPAALVIQVALPLAAAGVLARALAPSAAATKPGLWRTAGAATLVGLGTILPLLVYQLDYDVPLGVPNWLVLVATAAVLAAAGARRRRPGGVADSPVPGRSSAWLVGAVGGLVVLGTVLTVTRAIDTARESALSPEQDLPDQITLVSWNLHYGVDPAGAVDLEQVARTIEAQQPSVVALQEVSRGWVMGGGADMATWLADRLGMRMSFAPAADRQFGNVILTSRPQDAVTVLELPYGAGPQRRSALSADVQVAGGPIRITSVHLQHREENTPTRLDQIATLLAAEGDAPLAVIAGDLNAEPGWPEIELLTRDNGWLSAQDVAGDPAALTSPSNDPQDRIDWVLGRGVTFLGAEVRGDAFSSDHLPLVVILRPDGAS